MARATTLPTDRNGAMPTAHGPNSLASLIVVPPVTAVVIVQRANMYPSRLWMAGYLFRNDVLN
jgi:hypothetical protein